jgi:hypothetical protein
MSGIARVGGNPSHQSSVWTEEDLDLDFSGECDSLSITSQRIFYALLCKDGDAFLSRAKNESSDADIGRLAKEAAENRQWLVLEFLADCRLPAIQKCPEYEDIMLLLLARNQMTLYHHLK